MFPPIFMKPQQVFVNAFNALLKREDWAKQKIKNHAGKIVKLNISSWSLLLKIADDGTVQWWQTADSANVTLTITDDALKELPKALQEKADMDRLASLLHIEGDAGLAKLVSELALNLRWDIEAELIQTVGPFMASILLNGFKKIKQTSEFVSEKGLEKTKDFLSQDYHVIVQKPVVQVLQQDIVALQQSLTKLEQRIHRLQKV
ncbi:SCP2 domain-containing protein [Pelistega sp. MC2]|uniref:ubiquinone biosynthesis accessory factor UbiJ n=1 Tax=Pelistega sp. MC2 TaxID=1720297 RepID=UPI0009F67B6B|nr:SCP2 sterol-binding domain-containing protein [Pelistega sp. MC2]